MPTRPLLDFRLAHARARDAVHFPLDIGSLQDELEKNGWPAISVHSAATNRDEYLKRPDLGRTLDPPSIAKLNAINHAGKIVIVIADGLSALAVHRHAIALIDSLFSRIGRDHIAPIVIAKEARVALGDPVGELMGAELVVVLIGERPGLSAPDSLGAYLTWSPRSGRTDAERNCVSNIHAQGLSYDLAAHKLAFLITEAWRRQLTGVMLKEESHRTFISTNVRSSY